MLVIKRLSQQLVIGWARATSQRDNNLVAREGEKHKKVGLGKATAVDSILSHFVIHDSLADLQQLCGARLISVSRFERIDQHFAFEYTNGSDQ